MTNLNSLKGVCSICHTDTKIIKCNTSSSAIKCKRNFCFKCANKDNISGHQFLLCNWTRASFRCPDCIKNQLTLLETTTGSRFSLKDEMDCLSMIVNNHATDCSAHNSPTLSEPPPTLPVPCPSSSPLPKPTTVSPLASIQASPGRDTPPHTTPKQQEGSSDRTDSNNPLIDTHNRAENSTDTANDQHGERSANPPLNESSSSEDSFTSSLEETIIPTNDASEANEQPSEQIPHNNGRSQPTVDPPPTETNTRINRDDRSNVTCKFFNAGYCRLTKRLCNYDHPKLCRFYLRNPHHGCKKENCNHYHPTLCKSFEEYGRCTKICFKFHRHRAYRNTSQASNGGFTNTANNNRNNNDRSYSRHRIERLIREAREGPSNLNQTNPPLPQLRQGNTQRYPPFPQPHTHRNPPPNIPAVTTMQESGSLPTTEPQAPTILHPTLPHPDMPIMCNERAPGFQARRMEGSPNTPNTSAAPQPPSTHPETLRTIPPPLLDTRDQRDGHTLPTPCPPISLLPHHTQPWTHQPTRPTNPTATHNTQAFPVHPSSPPTQPTLHTSPLPLTDVPQPGPPPPEFTHAPSNPNSDLMEATPHNFHQANGIPPQNNFLYEMIRRQIWSEVEPLFHQTAHRVMSQMQVPPPFLSQQV